MRTNRFRPLSQAEFEELYAKAERERPGIIQRHFLAHLGHSLKENELIRKGRTNEEFAIGMGPWDLRLTKVELILTKIASGNETFAGLLVMMFQRGLKDPSEIDVVKVEKEIQESIDRNVQRFEQRLEEEEGM